MTIPYMKKNLLLILALFAVAITGCKKDGGTKPAGTTSSDSYLPVTSGSSWRYLVNGPGGSDTLTVKMTGATTIINSKTYYNATSTSKMTGTGTGYFYAANHIYGIRGSNAAAGLTVEMQIFNDALTVGNSWTSLPTDNGEVNGVPAKTINTIKGLNISKVINGKTFTNVVHTQVDLQYDYGSGFQSFAVYDYYLAKGIGMVELDSAFLGSLIETETVVDYTVK
jgi:hypothetical protein